MSTNVGSLAASPLIHLGTTKVDALKGVSLEITPGEFTALAGPSGSGKSTIHNLVGCIDTPTSGCLRVGGREVSGLTDKQRTEVRRSAVGFVFQSFNLIPVPNVLENIELPLLLEKNGLDTHEKTIMDQARRVITVKAGLLVGDDRKGV